MKTELISLSAIEIAEEIADFRTAIIRATKLLVSVGCVKEHYIAEVVENFERLGPYFAVSSEVTIAHAKPSASVKSAGLALLKISNPVLTGSSVNPTTQLVFALATPNPDAHVDLMGDLALKLTDPEVVNSLLIASAKSVIWEILNR